MPSLHPDADADTVKKDSHLGNYIEGKEETSSVAIPSLQRPQRGEALLVAEIDVLMRTRRRSFSTPRSVLFTFLSLCEILP